MLAAANAAAASLSELKLNSVYVQRRVTSGGKMSIRSSISVWRAANNIELKQDDAVDAKFLLHIEHFCPPAYSSAIHPEAMALKAQIMEAFDYALVFPDHAHILTAFNLLKSFVMLKYPLHRDDRECLIAKLFTLLYDHCKYTSLVSTTCASLANLITAGRQQIDIVIDWRPLSDLFKTTFRFASEGTSYVDIDDSDKTKLQTNLISLVIACRPFFAIDSFDQIMSEAKDWMCPHSTSMFMGIYTLSYFLPAHHLVELKEVPHWVLEFFTYWEQIEHNVGWDERWVNLFWRIIKHATNIDWAPYAPRLYTHFLKIIDLSIGNPKFSHLKPIKHHIPSTFVIKRVESLEYTAIGGLAVTLLKYNTIELLQKLLSSISTYFHPSNQGDWTASLLEAIGSLSHYFAKYHHKTPYPSELVEQVVDTVLPHITSTLYSKKKNITLSACKIIKELAYLAPQKVFPKLLERVYASVGGEEVHRIVSELEVVSTCFHPLISQPEAYPEGISHVYNLLELASSSIDSSYPNKASAAFKFLNRIFQCVLLNDETVHNEQEDYASEHEKQAALSTSSFLDWSLLLLDSVLSFIKDSATKKDIAGRKRQMPTGLFLWETMELFFSQMSDDIYSAVLEKLAKFFSKSYYPDYYKQYSIILMAATLRNPSKALARFLPIFLNKVLKKQEGKYQLRDCSDEEYRWYLSLVGYSVFKTGNSLPEHKDTIISVCKVLMESGNKVLVKQAAKIVRKSIFSLTRYYPSNNRSIPKTLLAEQDCHIKYWGQTNEGCYPIEWFQPNENTIQFAKELIELFAIQRVAELDKYIDEIKTNPSSYDRMKVYNYTKGLSSVLRTAMFVVEDTDLAEPVHVPESKYNPPPIPITHGRVTIKELGDLTSKIYHAIDKLHTYMEKEKDDEVLILKQIVKVYYVLQYGINDVHDKNSDVLHEKWFTLKKLKTRNMLVFKSFKEHLTRQKLFHHRLPVTKCLKSTLSALNRLAVHNYVQVRTIAQEAIQRVLLHHPSVYHIYIPTILDLYESLKSEEVIKGTIHLFFKKQMMKRLRTNFAYVQRIFSTYVGIPQDAKLRPSTREQFSNFIQHFVLNNSDPTIVRQYSNVMINVSLNTTDIPNDVIIKEKAYVDKKNEESIHSVITMIGVLNDALLLHQKKDHLNWKDHLIFQNFATYLVGVSLRQLRDSYEGNCLNIAKFTKSFHAFKNTLDCTFYNLACDYPISRLHSVNLLSSLFPAQDMTYFEKCSENYWINHTKAQKPVKTAQVNEIAKKLAVTSVQENLKELVNNEFLDKMIHYLSLDQDAESQSYKLAAKVSQKLMTAMWPHSRHWLPSFGFVIQFATLFYGLTIIREETFFELIKPYIEKLRTRTDKEDQNVLAEIIGGLGRYYATTPDTPRTPEVISYLSDLLYNSLSTCSNELTDSWMTCIRYMSYNTKVHRLKFLEDTLFRLTEGNSPENISSQSKSLKFLKALMFEYTFKSKPYLDRVLVIAQKEFSNPYKQVRDEAFRLFTHVLVYQTQFQDKDGNLVVLQPPTLPADSIAAIDVLIKDATDASKVVDGKNITRETLIAMVEYTFSRGFSNTLLRLVPKLLPVIISFTADTNQDTSSLATICVTSMAQGFYSDSKLLDEIINSVKSITSTSWRVRRATLPFLQILFFNHSILFTPQQIDSVYNIVLGYVNDPQIEVREYAKNTLTSLLKSSKHDTARIKALISNATTQLSQSKTTSANASQKHQYILTLSSIVLSSPYQIPTYFPEVLDHLSRYSSSIFPLSNTVQNTLSEFWLTHKDTWEEEKLNFTEDEIEKMHDTVAYPSYYA
ncbi:hypothetical protein SAMD00019534_090100 [Acytostelium subglobosum LB1]|uniref:hypothetical protein n=1 Tax=Acytostelium subglobosum LB1 TaxID=1410327 RepID=UPI000644E12F|nr:hypothetical protein SAMD00019534_090100 [Acytostelium subglobosum LB1]GAM25835.1 hypothetical protein SAMD00019534_090100 [Acytostelium subglobosum LB1]|eukprot:XP_012751353.1 hypothetical protein SAMD00019534_090100 [Acytostelium subglobosum LB1]